jgi:hypothetical protein
MSIKELIRKTPELTEEKLLEIIDSNKSFLDLKEWSRGRYTAKEILDEWDLIQLKKSNLTKSQRDQICALVSVSLVNMVKDDGASND